MRMKRTVFLSLAAVVIGLGGALVTSPAVAAGGGGGCPDQMCLTPDVCGYYLGWWCQVEQQVQTCFSSTC